MLHLDKKFDIDIIGEQITIEMENKQQKIGKIITQKLNCGLAMIDLSKLS